MKFKVSVEKRMYSTGTIEIDCDSEDQAIEITQDKIDKGLIQTTEVEWSEPEYEDFSFNTTGDID